ncbi:MAG: hypothetical protein KDA90_20540 [Planctomycetaceae bacterium]|nr:hypothetical protein [Planctomycetaceae bacterium]
MAPCKPKHRPPQHAPSPESTTPTASRSSWSGHIELSQLHIPVKAYPAAVTPRSLICQLHSGCGRRIEHRKYCPTHGPIPATEIAKGYPYSPGELIELSAQDVDALAPPDNQTVALQRFANPEQFDIAHLSGRSFYLLPAHSAASSLYGAFVTTLQRRNVWGLGTMVLSGHRQLLAVRADADQLLLHILHWPAQRRSCPARLDPSPESVRNLLPEFTRTITAAEGPIAWETYRDDEEQRLADLVQCKVAQRAAPAPRPRRSRAGRSRTSSPSPKHTRKAA